ncbi:MAG: glycerol-3-phosphate acyltransferase [Clostridiales bacterium]|nr:glycerol-3-phosphate acyltransferase [Clostridiales bacterium]
MIVLYLLLVFVVGYLIGNVNFARIFSLAFAKKDITTVGSKNPGTMNMLRTRGFGEAFLTLMFEAIKSGAPAIAMFFTFEHFWPGIGNVAYFLMALGTIVGHCFPVFYKFKGGKGVACTFGMFLFHPEFWWISIIVFVGCFLLFLIIEYPFIISFVFILTMSIVATCKFAIGMVDNLVVILFLIWMNVLLILFMHRSNIKRLVRGKENKVNLREKIFKKKHKTEDAEQKSEVATERKE